MENPYEIPVHHDTKNAILALLNGNPVAVEKTKTFGCSIKWASKAEWRKKLDTEWQNKPVGLLQANIDTVRNIINNNSEKFRLVNVWASWCGPCIVEFPELVDMQRMFGARNFEFISISTDGVKKEEKVLEFLREKNAAVKNYLFSGMDKYDLIETVCKDWSGALPFTALIAPGGEIVYLHEGAIDPLEVRKVIVNKIGRFFADD
jgi:thiol-disulfide isomerase/thioredoxin